MKVLPLARQSSLVVKELDDETLIYDLESDQAHCLNDTAARIWKSCDGQTSVAEIALNLGANGDAPVEENVVWLALDQLEKFKLLDEPLARPASLPSGISRRQAVRALGVAAILLPMVTSIVVPNASHAQSVVPLGGCCVSPSDCACPPSNSACCDQPQKGDPACVDYRPNPQMSTKQCY